MGSPLGDGKGEETAGADYLAQLREVANRPRFYASQFLESLLSVDGHHFHHHHHHHNNNHHNHHASRNSNASSRQQQVGDNRCKDNDGDDLHVPQKSGERQQQQQQSCSTVKLFVLEPLDSEYSDNTANRRTGNKQNLQLLGSGERRTITSSKKSILEGGGGGRDGDVGEGSRPRNSSKLRVHDKFDHLITNDEKMMQHAQDSSLSMFDELSHVRVWNRQGLKAPPLVFKVCKTHDKEARPYYMLLLPQVDAEQQEHCLCCRRKAKGKKFRFSLDETKLTKRNNPSYIGKMKEQRPGQYEVYLRNDVNVMTIRLSENNEVYAELQNQFLNSVERGKSGRTMRGNVQTFVQPMLDLKVESSKRTILKVSRPFEMKEVADIAAGNYSQDVNNHERTYLVRRNYFSPLDSSI